MLRASRFGRLLPRAAVLVPLAAVLGWLTACGPAGPPGWEAELLAHRANRDRLFAGSESPLAPTARPGFTGLAYFPPAPELLVEVPPDFGDAGRAVEMLDTKGAVRSYVVDSVLKFRLEGRPVRLTVYRSADGGELFVPFRDATAGSETYAGGRYLEAMRLPNGLYRVDFNYAYNPYCAYDERWACPIVPEENVLDAPVRAGEKAFSH